MKKLMLIAVSLCLLIVSCRKAEQKPGVVKIDAVDSLLYLNGAHIGHLGLVPGEFQFNIPALSGKLDSINRILTKMEDTGSVQYERMCLLTMREEQPFIDLFRIGLTCFRSGFTYVQLQPLNQLAAPELTLCMPDRPVGLTHNIFITSKGFWITLPYEMCFWGPSPVPAGKNVAVPRAHKIVSPYPDAAAVFVPLKDAQYDWSRFEAELAQVTEQLSRINYTYGRHFVVSAEAGLTCGDIRKTGRIIQKTLPKLKLTTVRKASLIDITYPAFKGRIPLPENQSIGADSFSVGIGMITDTLVDSSYFNTVDTTRFGLLGQDNLLVTALWQQDHELLQSLFGIEMDINRYPARHFPDNADWRGYTPLMLAIEKSDTFAVRFLLDKGADIKKPSRKYDDKTFPMGINFKDVKPSEKGVVKTPIQLAKEIGNRDIIDLLTERMK